MKFAYPNMVNHRFEVLVVFELVLLLVCNRVRISGIVRTAIESYDWQLGF